MEDVLPEEEAEEELLGGDKGDEEEPEAVPVAAPLEEVGEEVEEEVGEGEEEAEEVELEQEPRDDDVQVPPLERESEEKRSALLEGALATPRSTEKLPWSLYKKQLTEQPRAAPVLRAGFDPTTDEEKRKRLARLERWDPTKFEQQKRDEEEAKEEYARRAKRLARFGKAGADGGAEWTDFTATTLTPLGLVPEDLYASENNENDTNEAAHAPSERLHLRVLKKDRESFKKLRSSDVEAHFAAFRPTYVEWLGDQSCNVWFNDTNDAARALDALAVVVPSRAPASFDLPGFIAPQIRLLKDAVVKARTDRWGTEGHHATRLLCRFAGENDVLRERPTHTSEHDDDQRRRREKKKQRKKKSRTLGGEASSSSDAAGKKTLRRKRRRGEVGEGGGGAVDDDDDDKKDDDLGRAASRRRIDEEQEPEEQPPPGALSEGLAQML